MDIVAVRIGDKYGPEYETYLENKLPEHNFIWVREPYHPSVTLQWNKMWGMQMDTDEPICVMDIDILLVNDYKKVFDYPIKPGQFLAMPGWWRKDSNLYQLNGGFFKYYPKECRYIYDKFMSDVHHWQKFYIENGTTTGPVNGEQYFVGDSVNEKLELITLPDEWFTRWVADDKVIDFKNNKTWQYNMTERYEEVTGNDWIYMGGEFHPDIKFVHFTNHRNKPHEWSDYENFNNGSARIR